MSVPTSASEVHEEELFVAKQQINFVVMFPKEVFFFFILLEKASVRNSDHFNFPTTHTVEP